MELLFNILSVISLCLFYGMFIAATATGKLVMRGFELVRTIVVYAIAIYVYLSSVFALPMFGFVNEFFWNVPAVWWSGIVLMYLAIAVYYIDVISFWKYLAIGVDKNSKGLKTTGLYSHSRNPMYVSFMLFWLGGFLAFANLGMLLILLGGTIFLNLQVIFKEEPFLKERYGAEYVEYCNKVRRWV